MQHSCMQLKHTSKLYSEIAHVAVHWHFFFYLAQALLIYEAMKQSILHRQILKLHFSVKPQFNQFCPPNGH
jgi:hypothetical protein